MRRPSNLPATACLLILQQDSTGTWDTLAQSRKKDLLAPHRPLHWLRLIVRPAALPSPALARTDKTQRCINATQYGESGPALANSPQERQFFSRLSPAKNHKLSTEAAGQDLGLTLPLAGLLLTVLLLVFVMAHRLVAADCEAAASLQRASRSEIRSFRSSAASTSFICAIEGHGTFSGPTGLTCLKFLHQNCSGIIQLAAANRYPCRAIPATVSREQQGLHQLHADVLYVCLSCRLPALPCYASLQSLLKHQPGATSAGMNPQSNTTGQCQDHHVRIKRNAPQRAWRGRVPRAHARAGRRAAAGARGRRRPPGRRRSPRSASPRAAAPSPPSRPAAPAALSAPPAPQGI